jgi:hypothetical protein
MLFVMNTNSPLTQKLASIFDWLTPKKGPAAAPITKPFYPDITKYPPNAPTRPSRIVRRLELLEPVTEQQKIMDLAG